MAPRLISLYGFPGCGKDTAADVFVENGWEKIGFADILKEMLVALDPIVTWKRTWLFWSRPVLLSELIRTLGSLESVKRQYPEVRRLLQRLGTEAGREVLGEDVWVNATRPRIERAMESGGAVVKDMRFPNEYDLVEELGGMSVRVVRPGYEGLGHESERHYEEFYPDRVLENKSGVLGLKMRAYRLLK